MFIEFPGEAKVIYHDHYDRGYYGIKCWISITEIYVSNFQANYAFLGYDGIQGNKLSNPSF